MSIIFFNSYPSSLNVTVDEETGDETGIIRKALVFVAGDHTDSKKRDHSFPEDRVFAIVENTNRLFETGGSIPVLFDHDKKATSVVGALEAPLRTKVITEDDIRSLPNGNRLQHLVGKLGVFCDKVSLRAKEAIDCFTKNLVKTVSPGIDIATDTMRELSIVATPAIAGLSLYSADKRGVSHFANFSEDEKGVVDGKQKKQYEIPRTTALSLADALNTRTTLADKRVEYDDLCDLLWQVIENLYEADPNELGEIQPIELLQESMDEFAAQVYELLEIESEDEYLESAQNQHRGSEHPAYLQKQQELDKIPQARSGANYSAHYGIPIYFDRDGYPQPALFSLGEVAEFAGKKSRDTSPYTVSPKGAGYQIGTAGLVGLSGLSGLSGLGMIGQGVKTRTKQSLDPKIIRENINAQILKRNRIGIGAAGIGASLLAGHFAARRMGKRGVFDWRNDPQTHSSWKAERAALKRQGIYR